MVSPSRVDAEIDAVAFNSCAERKTASLGAVDHASAWLGLLWKLISLCALI
jgi:hypothetical protein